MTARVLAAAAVLLSACASGSAPRAGAASARPAGDDEIPIVALRVTSPGKEGVLEVKSDGAIEVDGATKARFVGADVEDADGHRLIHVASDGAVTVTPPKGVPVEKLVSKRPRFNAMNELVVNDGGRIHVDDAGVVSVALGSDPLERAPLKIEGFTTAAKREVVLLVVLLTMPARAERLPPPLPPPPPSSPAASPPSPPPPP